MRVISILDLYPPYLGNSSRLLSGVGHPKLAQFQPPYRNQGREGCQDLGDRNNVVGHCDSSPMRHSSRPTANLA